MQTRHHQPEQRRASPQSAAAMYLIDAEAYARSAARLIELDPNPDAQREARILYLAASRIRARRWAT